VQSSVTKTPAIGAIAIPLRKATAGGRPQYANFHEKHGRDRPCGYAPGRFLPIGDVHGDFHAEPEINGLRGFPFHVEAP
jgi:hypothetical protein